MNENKMDIDVTKVVDKLTYEIGNLTKDKAILSVINETQGNRIQELEEVKNSQAEQIKELEEKLKDLESQLMTQ